MSRYLIVALIIAASVGATLWQSQYAYVPLEWGLMLSNAKDLATGQIPYKQIFIQYGYLTTAIQALAYTLLGGNLQSLMTVTSVAYAIGLFLVYRIAVLTRLTRWQALSILFSYFLFHPIAIYPWSNYIAFPLLLLGLKYNLQSKNAVIYPLLSGLFFGLAILAREGLAPAIIIFMLSSVVFQFVIKYELRQNIKATLIILLGIGLPTGIFVIYLISENLLNYWQQIAWNIPKIYAEVMFPHMRGFNILRPWSIFSLLHPLFDQINQSFIQFEPRWILFGLIAFANMVVFIKGIVNCKYLSANLINVKIALLSLLMISSVLHLPEVFRVATGSGIGLINVWFLLRNYKYRLYLYVSVTIALALTAIPMGSGYKFSTTNYFFPTKAQINKAVLISELNDFNGQKWQSDVYQYYLDISADLNLIRKQCPNIIYAYNNSHDAFLQIISPFLRYQLAPFWLFPEMLELRPDFDIQKKLLESQDLILLQSSNVAGVEQPLLAPAQFHLYRVYISPSSTGTKTELRLFIPMTCDIQF